MTSSTARVTSQARPVPAIRLRLFYRVFNYFSYIHIPHDAGDFSLIEKRVVQAILRFPERDLFLRGVRAFAGFKQIGVPYSPEPGLNARRDQSLVAAASAGAKHGILSFSNVPLTILSSRGHRFCWFSVCSWDWRKSPSACLYPERAASGITTVLLVVLFFGALNAFFRGAGRRVRRQDLRGGQAHGPISFVGSSSKMGKSATPRDNLISKEG